MRKPGRLAPLVFFAMGVAGLLGAWLPQWGDRQFQYILTAAIILVLCLLIFIYLLIFADTTWRRKVGYLCAFSGLLCVGIGSFRIEEVSGDLVPRLSFRWSSKPDMALPALTTGEGRPRKPPEKVSANPGYAAAGTTYPQFLGPRRDGILPGGNISMDWEKNPPVEIWRRPLGAGWSSFAVAGSMAITQEQRGENELVVCYDLATGDILWSHADRERFENVLGGIGPRATPAISPPWVYTLGPTGILNCLLLKDGSLNWSVNVLASRGCPNQEWGKSSSPMVLGGLVIVTAGGEPCPGLVAYRKDSGEEAWESSPAKAGYSSPSAETIAGEEQVLILNHNFLSSHRHDTGATLWSHPWKGGMQKVSQPVVLKGDRVLVSSGYGLGSELFSVLKSPAGTFETRSIWKNRNLKSKFANILIHGDEAYGLDDGIMVCIDMANGKRHWKGGRYGHGQLLLVGDRILVMSERGQAVVVRPDRKGLKETARIQMLEGKTWNHPALASPYLLVRNAEEAACYRLSMKAE